VKEAGIRNGFTTVIAPTGSISMIAGCSSGIEPVYSLVYEKNVKVGSFYYVNPVFEKAMKKMGIFDENLMEDILSNRSSVKNISYIPPQTKRIFVTAMDITPEDHIRAMASFQKWVDSSISKTINFPAEASVEDMRKGYVLAYRLGCKGVTVYRDSSIQDQVLVAATKESEKRVETAQHTYDEEKQKERLKVEIPEDVSALTKHMMEKDVTYTDGAGFYTSGDTNGDTTYTNGYTNGSHEMKTCPSCNIDLNRKEGCSSCPECGWGLCS
jgi:ribonucleoside-diphosphate reductase alpha chain